MISAEPPAAGAAGGGLPAGELPTGTVTFLFTDIEHSTLLLQELGDRWLEVLEAHRRILRQAIKDADGREVETEGDAFFVAFASAVQGAQAAVAAQRALAAHSWPGFQLRVRMGLHTGEAKRLAGGYVGLDVHRAARIAAAGHGGQVVASEATVTLIGNELPEGVSLRDLGDHRLKDLPRPERLFQLDVAGLPSDFPPLKTLDVRRNNLPLQLTPFIGREEELDEAGRLLLNGRLVTMVGAGGMGKTRLGIELASRALEHFADGVWLLELAPLAEPALAAPSLLAILGLREQPGRTPQATLTDHLSSRQTLIVLDNCEHLVEACARLASSLLQACPKLKILATSREALAVAGEAVWRIPSLALPAAGEPAPPVDQLMHWPALALFVDRAKAAQPAFEVTEGSVPTLVEFCRRLDGIPLALELAAARLRVLSLEQLHQRLDDRFRLLTGGDRSALPRQQTLRATIDWSYELLTGEEKALLRRVAAFAGGFSLEAVEEICGWDPLNPFDILELVAALTAKSLLVTEEARGEVRYGVLETIREYAEDKVQEAGEEAEARGRHQDWFLALAQKAEDALRGPDQFAWFERLDRELDNLRAGFKNSLDRAEVEKALTYAASLGLFWRVRGRFSEGREWLARALESRQQAGAPAYAKALAWAAYLAVYQGSFQEAERQAEESLVIYRKLGDPRGIGFALQMLGSVAMNQDHYDRALALEKESLEYARQAGDQVGQGYCFLYLGNIALHRGEYEKALDFLQEALGLFRAAGDRRSTGIVLRLMGNVEQRQGHYSSAVALLEDSLVIVREAKDKVDLQSALRLSGDAAVGEGDYARATAFFEEALELGRELDHPLGISRSMVQLGTIARLGGDLESAAALISEGLAVLDEREKFGIAFGLQAQSIAFSGLGRFAEAVQLLAAAHALREELGTPLALFDQAENDRELALLRERLSEAEFLRLWQEGAALAVGDALAVATLA